MSLYRNEFIEAIERKLSHPPNIESEQYGLALDEAIVEYSYFVPLVQISDTTGNGTFEVSLPADWNSTYSNIMGIEYPYDSTVQHPTMLAESDYTIYQVSNSTYHLRLYTAQPTTGEILRISYTVPHTVTTTATSISITDERNVLNYACGLVCEIIAAEFEKQSRTSLPNVTVDLQMKYQQWQTTADRYYQRWRTGMKISDDTKPRAASTWTNIQGQFSWRRPWITHPPVWRNRK